MDDSSNRGPSPASASVGKCRRSVEDEDAGDAASCTGKSCQSCTAGAIADCVAVCCCPCAVVNFLALALVRLPWAVARRCISGRRRRGRRGRLEGGNVGVPEEGGVSTSDVVVSCGPVGDDELNDHFSAEFKAGDVWLEMYEVGHLGFGRVSFTGTPLSKGGN